jgi:hypothetical protein
MATRLRCPACSLQRGVPLAWKEIAILRLAAWTSCSYVAYYHRLMALELGIDEELLGQIATLHDQKFPVEIANVISLTDAYHHGTDTRQGQFAFSGAQRVELLMTLAYYSMVVRVPDILNIQLHFQSHLQSHFQLQSKI